MIGYMKITYYHSLYMKEVSDIVAGTIEFREGKAIFSTHGRRYSILLEYVRKPQSLN